MYDGAQLGKWYVDCARLPVVNFSVGINSKLFTLFVLQKSTKRGGTIATVNSSVYSGRSSMERTLTAFQADPDRLMEVLVMPIGTEVGEI